MSTTATPQTLLCAGEVFTDLVFSGLKRFPGPGQEVKTDNFAVSIGGGAAITAIAAARLGQPAGIVTVWGTTVLDREVQSQLERSGVGHSLALRRPDLMSGVTVAISTQEDRSFLTYPRRNRGLEQYLLQGTTLACLGRVAHVHFALAPSRWGPFRDLVRQVKRQGVTVSWDLGWDPAAPSSMNFRALYRELDLVFLNEMEACAYAGTESTDEALKHFAHAQNTVVIKQGAAGCVASQRTRSPVRVKSIPVDATESTGAGDAFNGGFLHFWMADRPLHEALLAGNICGGLSTLSAGGVEALPTRSEFDNLIGQLAHSQVSGETIT